jgi:hypothetical protein
MNIGDTCTKGGGCSHNPMSQKRHHIAKKKKQNWKNIYVYHLKPWQSWQVVAFSFIRISRN